MSVMDPEGVMGDREGKRNQRRVISKSRGATTRL